MGHAIIIPTPKERVTLVTKFYMPYSLPQSCIKSHMLTKPALCKTSPSSETFESLTFASLGMAETPLQNPVLTTQATTHHRNSLIVLYIVSYVGEGTCIVTTGKHKTEGTGPKNDSAATYLSIPFKFYLGEGGEGCKGRGQI